MAESPVSLHQGGGTLAQAVLASAPEGMLIAADLEKNSGIYVGCYADFNSLDILDQRAINLESP